MSRRLAKLLLIGCIALTYVATGTWTVSVAAANESPRSSADGPVDFQTEIKPLLSDRCFKCHGPDEQHREAGLRLDTPEGAFAALSDEIAIIKPGDVENSELFFRITTDDDSLRMPPAGAHRQLGAGEIDLIRRWIEQGATWEQHWSFQPFREIPTPALAGRAWLTNEIDHFVLERIEAAGLQPTAAADKSRLLRRLSFDLTGLPPTSAELDEFLHDDSPDAYEKWVDRYLNRPAYGERMASDWLDVARYSDSFGYQVDRDRFVWPWRDWVIRSFNENLPYDQFATWQIARRLAPRRNKRPTPRDHVFAIAFAKGGRRQCSRRISH